MPRTIEVGDKAPLFTLTSHSGDKIALQNVLKENKVVVLAFYILDFTGDEKAG